MWSGAITKSFDYIIWTPEKQYITRIDDLRKAIGLLLDFVNRHPEISKTDRDLVNASVRDLDKSWNSLDKAKSYKDTIFTVKEETVGGVIDEVLKKYEK